MKTVAKTILAAIAVCGALTMTAVPASARGHIGITFGWFGPGVMPFGDPCDYYDYYDAPPPWGLPPDYCDYPVYFGPVFWGDMWYRGPIYYRWVDGRRLFWLNGGWHADQWHGPAPHVYWRDHGPGWAQPHYDHHPHAYGGDPRDGYRDGPGGWHRDGGGHYGGHTGRGHGGGPRGDGGHGGYGGDNDFGGGDHGGGHGGGHGGHR